MKDRIEQPNNDIHPPQLSSVQWHGLLPDNSLTELADEFRFDKRTMSFGIPKFRRHRLQDKDRTLRLQDPQIYQESGHDDLHQTEKQLYFLPSLERRARKDTEQAPFERYFISGRLSDPFWKETKRIFAEKPDEEPTLNG